VIGSTTAEPITFGGLFQADSLQLAEDIEIENSTSTRHFGIEQKTFAFVTEE
jgi:hypothetical protein